MYVCGYYLQFTCIVSLIFSRCKQATNVRVSKQPHERNTRKKNDEHFLMTVWALYFFSAEFSSPNLIGV